MPIWKSPNGDVQFEFDPRIIAGLLSRGEEVVTDGKLSKEEFENHKALIDQELGKLWGENEVGKTVLKVRPHALPSQPFSSESFRPPGDDPSLPFRQMIPNPLFNSTIREIQRVRKPNLLEAGLFDPNKMTWGELMNLRSQFKG